MSNKEKGDVFTQKVHEYLRRLGELDLENGYAVEVGFSALHKKTHVFDLGNPKSLVECKCFDWTVGDNNPGGKIATLNEAMLFFVTSPPAARKRVFVKRTRKAGKRRSETLAEYYFRLYKHFIPGDVEFWEFDEETLTGRRLAI